MRGGPFDRSGDFYRFAVAGGKGFTDLDGIKVVYLDGEDDAGGGPAA